MPRGFHVVGMRTAVDVNNCGVFLGRVKVVRLHHAVVEVRSAVGCLDGAALENGLEIVCPRVGSSQ